MEGYKLYKGIYYIGYLLYNSQNRDRNLFAELNLVKWEPTYEEFSSKLNTNTKSGINLESSLER